MSTENNLDKINYDKVHYLSLTQYIVITKIPPFINKVKIVYIL